MHVKSNMLHKYDYRKDMKKNNKTKFIKN